MTKIGYGTFVFFLAMASLANAQEFNWGENVGPISAIVIASDSARGLAVYSLPQDDSPIVGYVRSGVVVRAYNDFRKGWVKLKSPIDQGWVKIDALQPYPTYEALATKVNEDSLCLPIRQGPTSSAKEIACGKIGQVLPLSGVMTTTGWLQLRDENGWIDSSRVILQPIMHPAVQEEQGAALGANCSVRSPEKAAEPSGYYRLGPIVPERTASKEKEIETQIGCSNGYCAAVSENGRDRFFYGNQEITQKACDKEPACSAIFVSQLLKLKEAMGETPSVLVVPPNKEQFTVDATGSILNKSGEKVTTCSVESGAVNAVCLRDFLAKNTAMSNTQMAQPAMPE